MARHIGSGHVLFTFIERIDLEAAEDRRPGTQAVLVKLARIYDLAAERHLLQRIVTRILTVASDRQRRHVGPFPGGSCRCRLDVFTLLLSHRLGLLAFLLSPLLGLELARPACPLSPSGSCRSTCYLLPCDHSQLISFGCLRPVSARPGHLASAPVCCLARTISGSALLPVELRQLVPSRLATSMARITGAHFASAGSTARCSA